MKTQLDFSTGVVTTGTAKGAGGGSETLAAAEDAFDTAGAGGAFAGADAGGGVGTLVVTEDAFGTTGAAISTAVTASCLSRTAFSHQCLEAPSYTNENLLSRTMVNSGLEP